MDHESGEQFLGSASNSEGPSNKDRVPRAADSRWKRIKHVPQLRSVRKATCFNCRKVARACHSIKKTTPKWQKGKESKGKNVYGMSSLFPFCEFHEQEETSTVVLQV